MTRIKNLEFKRIATLYLLGFLLVFGYSIARPCIDSLFLEHYSSDALPHAWLYIALATVVVIVAYNRYNQRYALLTLFSYLSLISAFILILFLSMYLFGFIPAIYLLYIWKEIYMVVLMETYWSYADIVFSVSTARHTYGLALAISSFGGVLGNLLIGPFAHLVGTNIALSSLVFFLVLGCFIAYAARFIGDEKPRQKKNAAELGLGIKTLIQSKYLVPLAFLVLIAQIVSAFIDYRFNTMLQQSYVNIDARTEVLGQIHAIVNVFGIAIQLATSQLLKVIGIGNAFMIIPIILGTFILLFLSLPKFAIMVAVKISNKALDYSLFRGVKEILYIPLSREEKTQGKGIIDIFMYRLARGLSSLILMVLISLSLSDFILEFTFVLVLSWLLLAYFIVKRYQKLIKNPDDA
jgi:AAA family ATP:ADP antiporter